MTSPGHPSASSPGIPAWRILLRLLAGLMLLACFAFWAAAGANRGWTKNQLGIKKTDEITGIEYTEYRDHFQPGLELLTAGVGFSLLLAGSTFFFRQKSHPS